MSHGHMGLAFARDLAQETQEVRTAFSVLLVPLKVQEVEYPVARELILVLLVAKACGCGYGLVRVRVGMGMGWCACVCVWIR